MLVFEVALKLLGPGVACQMESCTAIFQAVTQDVNVMITVTLSLEENVQITVVTVNSSVLILQVTLC